MPQFFTGLGLSDPLHLTLNGEELELAHAAHRGAPVKGDTVGAWSDEYASTAIKVRISYRPAPSTCSKPKGEPCEYSDYLADVTLQRSGQAIQRYKARASCGC
jgi:hypothetical protein